MVIRGRRYLSLSLLYHCFKEFFLPVYEIDAGTASDREIKRKGRVTLMFEES